MSRPFYLLDTNILSEVLKVTPSPNVCAKLDEYDGLCAIPAVTWHELLYGGQIMSDGKKKDIFFKFLYDKIQPSYPVIPYDDHAASIHAEIRSRLYKLGKPMPYQDTQIAAVAIANNMIMVTRNTKHFEPIREVINLLLENWFEE